MQRTNFEFKAKVDDIVNAEEKLKLLNPLYKGEDHQIDTYFNVPTGRLKLREGNIENALIFYERENVGGAKQSNVLLYQHKPDIGLKNILLKTNGVKAIVDKKRKIYFIDNVKFHFDRVEGLGTFLEVEAIDSDGTIAIEKLKEQCAFYQEYLGISANQLLSDSYSDMIMVK
jgi:adenylate cyclase, class 2